MNKKYDWGLVKKLYLDGQSTTEISDTLHTSPGTIAHICRRLGIVRSVSEGKILRWRKQELSTTPRAQHKRARRLTAVRLDRKLEVWEDVHHKDSNLSNDSDTNLVVLPSTLHAQITNWAKGSGVGWHRASGKWRARVVINREEHYLGLFTSKQDALHKVEEYRKQFEIGLFGELVAIEKQKRGAMK